MLQDKGHNDKSQNIMRKKPKCYEIKAEMLWDLNAIP